MARPYPSFPEVKQLLESREMREYEQAVAQSMGLALLPYHLGTPSRLQRELYLANLSAADVSAFLGSNKARLIAFSVSLRQEETPEDEIDGEFPVGEEQDPRERSETIAVLGLSQGTGISDICFYWLASQKSSKELLTFLERTRIPYRQKVCSLLRRVYREVQAEES